jgi:hypothetical protein
VPLDISAIVPVVFPDKVTLCPPAVAAVVIQAGTLNVIPDELAEKASVDPAYPEDIDVFIPADLVDDPVGI